ncbi:MAG: biopolymer transporter ExbD [Acidobacteriota bacterium]
MGMGGGGGKGLKSEINVTPLVDVVLVLLIIFMVIIPMTQVGYAVNTPPKVETKMPQPQDNDQLIVRLDANGSIFINKEAVPEAQFAGRFREVIRNRETKIVFFAADGEITYDRVASVMDLCREAGAKNLGIVFDDLKPGPGAAIAVGLAQ